MGFPKTKHINKQINKKYIRRKWYVKSIERDNFNNNYVSYSTKLLRNKCVNLGYF